MPAGRPRKINDKVLRKLEEGFSMGFTDSEACLYADVGTTTLYEYCNDNPKFAERKEQLKKNPLIKAKRNIVSALNEGDEDMSKWYLERKAKKEFSAKQEVSLELDQLPEIIIKKG